MKKYRDFLKETTTTVEVDQAEEFHDLPAKDWGENSSLFRNPKIRSQVNYYLLNYLRVGFRVPEEGISSINKALERFGSYLPVTYRPDQEGEELGIDLLQYGQDSGYKIYIIFDLSHESGRFEFYAEVGDEKRIAELLLDEGKRV
tara:strand:+ start:31666 stop:32100 length:435 start_codon:yes stop_codon:yes gene_type:complete